MLPLYGPLQSQTSDCLLFVQKWDQLLLSEALTQFFAKLSARKISQQPHCRRSQSWQTWIRQASQFSNLSGFALRPTTESNIFSKRNKIGEGGSLIWTQPYHLDLCFICLCFCTLYSYSFFLHFGFLLHQYGIVQKDFQDFWKKSGSIFFSMIDVYFSRLKKVKVAVIRGFTIFYCIGHFVIKVWQCLICLQI